MSLRVDREARRAEVALAAYEIVAERGLDMLTVRAVAQAKGCSTAVVSHYFSGKQDLLSAVYRLASERSFARWEAVESAGGDLCACFKEVLPTDDEMRGFWRVYFAFWSVAASDPKLGAIHHAMLEKSEASARRLLIRHHDCGGMAPEDLDSLVRQVLALQSGIATQASIGEAHWPADQQISDLEIGMAKLLSGSVVARGNVVMSARPEPA